MVYKYEEKIKTEAYQLFAEGVPIRKIAKDLGINRHTITAWKSKFGWMERLTLIDENTQQLVDQNITNMRADGIKIFTGAIHAFANQIIKEKRIDPKTKKVITIYKDISAHEAVSMQRVLLTLYGEDDGTGEKTTIRMIKAMEKIAPPYQKKK